MERSKTGVEINETYVKAVERAIKGGWRTLRSEVRIGVKRVPRLWRSVILGLSPALPGWADVWYGPGTWLTE
jgi:hypothetical protein